MIDVKSSDIGGIITVDYNGCIGRHLMGAFSE
jgi:hypothetical protein